MQIKDLFKTLRNYIGLDRRSIGDFLAYFCDCIMLIPDGIDDDPQTQDIYHPFTTEKSCQNARHIFNGTRKFPAATARIILKYYGDSDLLDALHELAPDRKQDLCDELSEFDVICTETNVEETVCKLTHEFMVNAANGKKEVFYNPFESHDENGEVIPAVPIESVRLSGNCVYLGKTVLQLTPALVPTEEITNIEVPYTNALFEMYSKDRNQETVVDSADYLLREDQEHLAEQRDCFYSIESIRCQVRDAFSNGEEQFSLMVDDAYEGLSITYKKDAPSGRARLDTVQEKALYVPLDRSDLINIRGLIGNKARKGLPHMLVNQGFIKSWIKR